MISSNFGIPLEKRAHLQTGGARLYPELKLGSCARFAGMKPKMYRKGAGFLQSRGYHSWRSIILQPES